MTKQHELFRRYPRVGWANTSCGAQPVPYHVYDGNVFFMGATANLAAVEKLLANEHVYPIVTKSGRALMALWLCQFKEASHGAHNEIQFSVFVSREPMPPVDDNPLTLFPLLLLNPDARMLIHGIWNDSPAVVAYNNEVLGLGAKQSHGKIQHENGLLSFDFEVILEGEIHTLANTPPKMGMALLKTLGWKGIRAFMAQPYLNTQALSRVGHFNINASAQTFTHNDKVILQSFDEKRDRLNISHPDYRNIDFRLSFVEHMEGFKFVYLNPHDVADAVRPSDF
jgi:hypothetical protein